VPALAVNVTLPPVQNVVGPLGVMVAVGNALTVIIAVAVSWHVPLVDINCIVNVPAVLNVR
jgi:hypothetical protein